MSLLPSYHGSGIDIFLRPRSAGFRLEDLWSKNEARFMEKVKSSWKGIRWSLQ
jgi:hypothetical protein